MTAPTLREALRSLTAVAAQAGVDAAAARVEGERLAAAVMENAGRPAALGWLDQVDGSELTEFFTAASAGRRWRSSPTDLLAAQRGGPYAAAYAQALADVARAAGTIVPGQPHIASGAARTAAIQLAGSAAAPAPAPSAAPPASTAPDRRDSAWLRRPLQGSRSSLQAIPPATAAPDVPSVESILDALGRGQGSAGGPPAAQSGPEAAPAGAAAAQQGQVEQSAVSAEQTPPQRSVEELLSELDELVGLERVKSEIRRQVQLLRIEKLRVDAGLTTPTLTRHLVFVGNPGTGKTTVARMVSQIYRALGLLSKGHLVEVDRSELVAGYLGQTATKTAEVVASALGGVLFIDEAYALTQSNTGTADSYGSEAVNTLVKEMEDHREDLVVIVAGYPIPMEEFVTANPGLRSRFSTTIHFEDYTDAQLRAIFELMATNADFLPNQQTLDRLEEVCSVQPRDATFGNARFVRNQLDAAIARHAWRLRDVEEPTLEELQALLPEDLVEPTQHLVPPTRAAEQNQAQRGDEVTTDHDDHPEQQ